MKTSATTSITTSTKSHTAMTPQQFSDQAWSFFRKNQLSAIDVNNRGYNVHDIYVHDNLCPDYDGAGFIEYDRLLLMPSDDLNGWVVAENFDEEKPDTIPIEVRDKILDRELIGQAVYGCYKKLGNALRALTMGDYTSGRKPLYWV